MVKRLILWDKDSNFQKTQAMNIQLIDGEFNPKEALELVTQMIHQKIKYHESKILNQPNEDLIKESEANIRRLQKQLYECSNELKSKSKEVIINATINIKE
jgi:hypothetical protein